MCIKNIVFWILLILTLTKVPLVYAASAPDLGAADSFSVLGFSNVTNTNLTTLSGDIGVWSGSSITGLGSINVGGTTHITDSVAQQAQADALTADGSLLSQANTGGSLGALDSLVLVPGVYDLGAGSLSGGVLTLNGAGVYIFRTTSTLVSAGSINLTNGARACDVFWHVESAATINGTSFVGTIIAKTGVHFGTGVTLDGRALAIGADVTMDTNNISGPVCQAAPTETPTPTTTPGPTSTPSPSPTPTPTTAPGPTSTPSPSPTSTPTTAPGPTSTPSPSPTSTLTPTATELPQTGGIALTLGLIVFGAISLASVLFLKFL